MLREGSGEPLLLLHGITASERIWRSVIPLLSPYHDTIALTALGHDGGDPIAVHPPQFEHLVDRFEEQLDELGLDTVHIAGNSMGGGLALQLARRGRARTVTAFSPAGGFDPGDRQHRRTAKRLLRMARDARRFRRVLPHVMRSGLMRRYALWLNAEHGERVAAEDIVANAASVVACSDLPHLLAAAVPLAPLDPPPCPITIAWSRRDRVLPLDPQGVRFRDQIVPGAEFLTLDGVGHVPMFDDPALVARVILARTGAAVRPLTPAPA